MAESNRRDFLQAAGLAGMFSGVSAAALAQGVSGAGTVDRGEYFHPGNRPHAQDPLLGHRSRPRAHLRHDPRHPARRRRAGVLLRARIRRRSPQYRKEFGDVKLARERRRDHRRQVHPAGPRRAHPRSARAARHPRDESRQGLPRRQARDHLARAARRSPQDHQGDQAQVRHHVFRAPRSALRGARR